MSETKRVLFDWLAVAGGTILLAVAIIEGDWVLAVLAPCVLALGLYGIWQAKRDT